MSEEENPTPTVFSYMCALSAADCPTCRNRAIAFMTNDPEEAVEHSSKNNAPMWIEKVS